MGALIVWAFKLQWRRPPGDCPLVRHTARFQVRIHGGRTGNVGALPYIFIFARPAGSLVSLLAHLQRNMHAYRQIKEIGRGSYGCAVLCEHKASGQRVVVKMVSVADMPAAERKAALQEVSILSSLHHPCIIGHIESFEDDGFLCIVCELAGG